ncbi:DUF6228 family protein [Streptomyces sp. NPDC007251]|uniref:DUF6228 family protein n=1 Tax=Streptomyces sp. NPDC007251 TaxID=3154483 RepID=UPI0033EF5DCA
MDARPDVIIGCRDTPSVGVRLCDRGGVDADSVHYAVELWAPGLTARVDEVMAWSPGRGLAAFLDELAAGYRGWDGERDWQTDDGDLVLSAVFRAGGHVGLTWSLRPWQKAAGGWSASVTTRVEAGEQMALLASEVRRFLSGR